MNTDIAVIGCGAIAQLFYLPALAKMAQRTGAIWLVDPSGRARDSALALVAGRAVAKIEDLPVGIPIFVIATPNKLHVPMALDALQKGAHVLIEKPFAIWPEEGRKLIQAAETQGRLIAVNQTRRFMPYMSDLRQRINKGEFGPLTTIIHNEGYKLSWPFESGAAFARTAERTGVIMDAGVHAIDFYQYLFQPEWNFVSATHDGFRGPEGLASIHLRANGVPVSIKLSRYYKQTNLAVLKFRDADVRIGLDELNGYTIHESGGSARRVAAARPVSSYGALAEDVLNDFLEAAAGRSAPRCPASSSMPVIEILDQVYRAAQLYPDAVGAV